MIEIRNLSKSFKTADGTVEALKNVSISIDDGDIFGIIGMSGAGKSTLVRCINFLEKPTSGSVFVDGTDLSLLSKKELRKLRQSVTMIFQGFNLLMQRNCLKNVCFPLELAGVKRENAETRARDLLELVGLSDKEKAYPAQLSGGQKQRVAIARALATNPKVLLCDEATSALDPNTTLSILELLRKINREMGITIVIITHQMNIVESVCKHVAIIDNGHVAEQGEVSEVFSHPRSQAAKRLVFPELIEDADLFEDKNNASLIRVVFNGAEATSTPLIAQMAAKEEILAGICYASTKSIGGRAYGSMILSVSGKEEAERTIKFLSAVPDVTAEEVRSDGE